MQDWWAESSKGRSGPHNFRAETFGLDPATGATGRIVPGNEHYRVGDKIPRDPSQAQAPSADIQLASSGSLHRLAVLGWRIEQGT